MTAEQASSHPLRRRGFALATFAAAAVGVSAFALAAATGDLSGGAKISSGGLGADGGLFGMRRAAVAGSSASSSSSGAEVRERASSLTASVSAYAHSSGARSRGRFGREEQRRRRRRRATRQKTRSMGHFSSSLSHSLTHTPGLSLFLIHIDPRLGLQAPLWVRDFLRKGEKEEKKSRQSCSSNIKRGRAFFCSPFLDLYLD